MTPNKVLIYNTTLNMYKYILSAYFLFIAFYSTDFVRDDNTDSGSIHKARLQGPDEISGDSNDSGLHSQDLSTKNGTLSSFV